MSAAMSSACATTAGADRLTLDEASAAYAREVRAWRERRGLTRKAFASLVAYHPSYISHIESGGQRPTEEFTRRAEQALDCGGALWARWEAWRAARWGDAPPLAARPPAPMPWQPLADQMATLEHRLAELASTLVDLAAVLTGPATSGQPPRCPARPGAASPAVTQGRRSLGRAGIHVRSGSGTLAKQVTS